MSEKDPSHPTPKRISKRASALGMAATSLLGVGIARDLAKHQSDSQVRLTNPVTWISAPLSEVIYRDPQPSAPTSTTEVSTTSTTEAPATEVSTTSTIPTPNETPSTTPAETPTTISSGEFNPDDPNLYGPAPDMGETTGDDIIPRQ